MTFTANCQIIRNNQDGNYSQLDNRPARDKNLSAEARGTLYYLGSNSDRWHLTMKNLADMMNMGINRTRRVMRELRDRGLIQHENGRDAAGKYIGWKYKIVLPPEQRAHHTDNPEALQVADLSSTPIPSTPIPSTPDRTDIIKLKSNKIQKNKISPTPQIFDEEEIDFWFSDSEPETCQEMSFVAEIVDPEPSETDFDYLNPTGNVSTALVSNGGESSAACYNIVTAQIHATKSNTFKLNRKERRTAQREKTWVEFGKSNGLWQSMEDLQGFMSALYTHAVNNPRLHTPSKWVESEVQKTCEHGTGTHWTEYHAGLQVGTIDQKPWRDVYGNVNPSFKSYVEQSKFGESGNSTSRAVELAAQVLADPFKTGSIWKEYQRRLERELEEKAKCARLGITYDAPNVLKPKSEVSTAQTARTQQILGIDADPQTYHPALVESANVPVLGAGEDELDFSAAPWDKIAADMETKMAELAGKMGISKPSSALQATPLSEVYAEPKQVNQTEAQEFKAWYDSVEAQGLVDYSYSDPKNHAIVVLADGKTALPWREARKKLTEAG